MRAFSHRQSGMTLTEVTFAVALLSVFFGCVFQLNAVCLNYIQSSKEAIAAMQAVQDRTETLRNIVFTDLVDADYVKTLLASAANASDFANKRATEVVQISAYPTAHGTSRFTRTPNGTVTQNSTATDLGDELVQISVTSSWTATFRGQQRVEEATTIISNGTKK